jgi:UDP-glucuronate decarboxylase
MGESPDSVIGPINLGNPVEYTILSLAILILNLTNSSSPTIFKPLPADDPKQRKPNIENAIRQLNWHPTTAIEDGLKQTITYFDSVLDKHPLSIS